MDALTWERKPELRAPTLICAFKGWNDAAGSASAALEFIASRWSAKRFAAIDPEEFFDFQVNRPTVRLTEGQTREIEWPELVFSSARVANADHDAVLVTGSEPNLRWRSFCRLLIAAAQELDVSMVVTLGALLADVPHTRPVQITGIASDESLVDRLGFSQTRYQGPTGIVGVLHDSCARVGLPSASLWAPVPHYVAAVPSPKAALALIRTLEGLLETGLDATDLEEAAEQYEERLDEAVASEPEIRSMVERLEQQMDQEDLSLRDLPSGDSIAREFERFLRDRGKREE
jgi:predicted ATP-grasp superfamily ATP-dependent carboligase